MSGKNTFVIVGWKLFLVFSSDDTSDLDKLLRDFDPCFSCNESSLLHDIWYVNTRLLVKDAPGASLSLSLSNAKLVYFFLSKTMPNYMEAFKQSRRVDRVMDNSNGKQDRFYQKRSNFSLIFPEKECGNSSTQSLLIPRGWTKTVTASELWCNPVTSYAKVPQLKGNFPPKSSRTFPTRAPKTAFV